MIFSSRFNWMLNSGLSVCDMSPGRNALPVPSLRKRCVPAAGTAQLVTRPVSSRVPQVQHERIHYSSMASRPIGTRAVRWAAGVNAHSGDPTASRARAPDTPGLAPRACGAASSPHDPRTAPRVPAAAHRSAARASDHGSSGPSLPLRLLAPPSRDRWSTTAIRREEPEGRTKQRAPATYRRRTHRPATSSHVGRDYAGN